MFAASAEAARSAIRASTSAASVTVGTATHAHAVVRSEAVMSGGFVDCTIVATRRRRWSIRRWSSVSGAPNSIHAMSARWCCSSE